eukprot:6357870-Ditylum_brightwellii.AAC.1
MVEGYGRFWGCGAAAGRLAASLHTSQGSRMAFPLPPPGLPCIADCCALLVFVVGGGGGGFGLWCRMLDL